MSTREPNSEDVESAISGLERRLRALQAELDSERGAPAPHQPPPAPAGPRVETARATTERSVPPRPAPRRRETDAPAPALAPAQPAPSAEPDALVAALERFGADLRRLTGELNAAWERLVEDVLAGGGRAEPVFSGEVALEVEARLGTLASIDAALASVPGVRGVALRTYAGRRAVLDISLDGEVALVAELRANLGLPFTVAETGPGLLAIDLGETG